MVQKIIRLSEPVINKIAAGEVVENPASVVKELIENSLDAGASIIHVRMREGGQDLIEVEDNGCGMNEADALLSLERHATSKIRSEEDLHSLTTMGFRGEALAAIAAVSQLELKTSEGDMGVHICVEGGTIRSVFPIARNRGTTLSVRSLFFNVPARKKFQKSASANAAQVVKGVENLAMAHPEVAFSLSTPKEVLLDRPIEEQKKRVEAIAGSFAHEILLPSLRGFFGAPMDAKTSRRNQVLFINRRPVFSPLIARAVQAGYGTRLPEHAYPPFVLFLEVDPLDVDVNVHPQKKEVRLNNESAIFRQVETAVAEMFSPPSLAHPIAFDPPPSFLLAKTPSAPSMRFRDVPLPLQVDVPMRPLAVIEGYLLVDNGDVKVVDLKAAQARVLFENLQKEDRAMQPLLWPLEITLEDPEDTAALETMGIACRQIGPRQWAIDSLPQGIDPSDFPSFFDAWKAGRTWDSATVRYCCGRKKLYSLDEAFLLWRTLQQCRDSLYDPLGKRIWRILEKKDLERWV